MKKILLAILIPYLLVSCAPSRLIELGGQASKAGMELCNEALDVYSTLSEQSEIDRMFQDRIKILTNPDPASMTLPDSEAQDFPAQLEVRKEAYRSLLKTYKVFNLLSDRNYASVNEQAVEALQDSYNAIEGIPGLPADVSSRLPEVARYLSQSFQAKKIKKHNEALYSLSEAYLALWQEDKGLWIDYIERIYGDYADGLNQVSSDLYDPELIAKDLNLPYKDGQVLLLMYRLELRRNLEAQKNTIIQDILDVEKALKELTHVHGEISKDKPSIPDIISTLDKIESFIEK